MFLPKRDFTQLSHLEITVEEVHDFDPFRGINPASAFPALVSLNVVSEDVMEWLVTIPSVKTLSLSSSSRFWTLNAIQSRLQLFPATTDLCIGYSVDRTHRVVGTHPLPAVVLPSLHRLSIVFRQVFGSKGRLFHFLGSIEAPHLVDFSYHFEKGRVGLAGKAKEEEAKLTAISRFLAPPLRNGTLASVSIMFPAKDVISDAGLASLAQGLTGIQSLCLYLDGQSYSVLLQSNLPNITSLSLSMTPSTVDKVQETFDTARSFLQGQSRRIEFSLDVGFDEFLKRDRQAAKPWLQEAGFHFGRKKAVYTVRWTSNLLQNLGVDIAFLGRT